MILHIMKYAVHDGPGIRSTVFFKGCPLHCLWCHNPESVSFSPQTLFQAEKCLDCGLCQGQKGDSSPDAPWLSACPGGALERAGQELTASAILDQVEQDSLFYSESGGGVTFSGGEPLAQPQFLAACLTEAGQRGIHRAVDTSGYAPQETICQLHPLVDLWLFDLKHLDPATHRRLTGVDNSPILANLRALAQMEAEINLRLPLIPGCNDAPANLKQTRDFLLTLPRRYPLHLLPYHGLGQDKHTRLGHASPLPPTPEPEAASVEAVAALFRNAGFPVTIGG